MEYKKIHYFQNRNRIRDLEKFRNLVNIYFDNISVDFQNLHENNTAKKTRSKINLITARITKILQDSGVSTTAYYSPPPSIGGLYGDIDILGNFFQAHVFNFDRNTIIDMIEKSMGVYENDRANSIVRTLNPLFWLNKLLTFVASLPFQLLENINVSIDKNSTLVKLIKLLFYLLQVVGILFPIALWLRII